MTIDERFSIQPSNRKYPSSPRLRRWNIGLSSWNRMHSILTVQDGIQSGQVNRWLLNSCNDSSMTLPFRKSAQTLGEGHWLLPTIVFTSQLSWVNPSNSITSLNSSRSRFKILDWRCYTELGLMSSCSATSLAVKPSTTNSLKALQSAGRRHFRLSEWLVRRGSSVSMVTHFRRFTAWITQFVQPLVISAASVRLGGFVESNPRFLCGLWFAASPKTIAGLFAFEAPQSLVDRHEHFLTDLAGVGFINAP